MRIQGLQTLTLLDFPGHTACTVFTGGCNFRCPFCHNASLVTEPRQEPACTQEEFFSFLKKRRGVLEGVAVTGGEPLLQPGLPAFLTGIRALGYRVKLDTNGSLPDKLRALVAAGLVDYVAMDVKNSKKKYALTAGTKQDILPAVEESVAFLLTDAVPYEFRTTVVRELHTRADILAVAQWLRGAAHWYLQSFKASDDLLSDGCSAMPEAELRAICEAARAIVPTVALRGV